MKPYPIEKGCHPNTFHLNLLTAKLFPSDLSPFSNQSFFFFTIFLFFTLHTKSTGRRLILCWIADKRLWLDELHWTSPSGSKESGCDTKLVPWFTGGLRGVAGKGKKIGGLTRGPTPPASRHCTRRKTFIAESRGFAEIVWPGVNPLLDLVHGFETNTRDSWCAQCGDIASVEAAQTLCCSLPGIFHTTGSSRVLPQCACGGNFSELQCRRQNKVQRSTDNSKLVFLFYGQH